MRQNSPKDEAHMKQSVIFFAILLGVGLISIFFLSNWHIPAPTKTITKIVANDRFNQ